MKNQIIIVYLILTISGCQSLSPIKMFSLPPLATSTPQISAPSKQIMLNTLPLVERWRWSGNINNGSISRPAVVIIGNRIVVIEHTSKQRIMTFDADTGQLMWVSDSIANVDSITADEKRVYIGTITYVQAFDLETGDKLWRSIDQPSMKKRGFVVHADVKNNHIEVYDILEPVVYILDSTTGNLIETLLEDISFRWNEINYAIVHGNNLLEARNAKTKEKLWSHQFPGYIGGDPVFFDDIMLLNSRGQIFGIKTKTGEIVWQTADNQTTYVHPQYITGMALQDNLAYTLKYDAAIVGIDPETGKQVGIIEMMPSRTLEDDKGEVKHYIVAASDKFVAVYYGNSQELIVFEKVGNLSSKTK